MDEIVLGVRLQVYNFPKPMQTSMTTESPIFESKLSYSHQFHSLEKPNLKLTSRAKLKLITSSSMNDTFANWRKKKKRTAKNQPQHVTMNEITDQDLLLYKVPEEGSGIRGMTLEEYVRSRSSSETRNYEPQTMMAIRDKLDEDDCDETRNYLKETFQIHETDEENYNESQKPVRTPEFNQPLEPEGNEIQKKIIDKYSKRQSKLKTETQEDQQPNFEHFRNKTRFPTMSTEDKEPSEQREDTKRPRIVSVPNAKAIIQKKGHTDLHKYEGQFKKTKILEKFRHQKDRINDLKINELGFVTKYASKFNINEAVCKQIIKDCRH